MMRDVIQGRILVRMPNWIGDAVMCEPALMDLRTAFPLAKICLLARPMVAELWEGHPGVDEIIEYAWQREHKGILGLARLIRDVRGLQFDMAVLFQNAFEAALIALAAGIARRVGYATDGRKCLMTQPIPLARSGIIHQMDYYRTMVSQAFSLMLSDRKPTLYLQVQEQKAFEKRFSEIFDPPDSMLVGINPGASYGSSKRWMPERFAELGDRLIRQLTQQNGTGKVVRGVIVGGKGEEELGRFIAGRMLEKVSVLSGKTTIRELMGVIQRCAIFLTNDSGPMHMAQALGVPVLAIFGSTDPNATGPVGQMQGVVRTPVRCAPCLLRSCPIDHSCMNGVTVEQAWNVAQSQVSHATSS